MGSPAWPGFFFMILISALNQLDRVKTLKSKALLPVRVFWCQGVDFILYFLR
jgi:hypothetical protein